MNILYFFYHNAFNKVMEKYCESDILQQKEFEIMQM